MIPILFAETETSFTTNGIGRLADATKCEVTEERNGQYELVMQYPIEGELFAEIVCGRYIYATHDESKVPQAFKIYRISAPLEGVITINAWHISYALNTIIVAPFTASNCSATLTGIKNNSMNTNPFTFWTDKSVNATFTLNVPTSARACLGGVRGSVLDVYGKGEYEFDMYTVKLHVNRGTNRDVTIRYGKNLTRLDQALDASNVYNSVVPYWTDGETVVSGGVITKAGQTPGATIALDLSRDFDDAPTVQELETKAQAHVDTTDNYILKENVKVDFVALWQTEEYKDYAALERVFLCDTVNVFYAKLGVNITAKVIKVVYDSLLERYTSIELGEPSTSLIQQIKTDIAADVLQNVPSTGMMQAAIDKATELINGGFGGYIKFKYLSDGTPSEMLVMDSPSEATAVNIIRLNKNGLGFSTDGGATYANAWTIDGSLVADFITSGTLSAIDITGVNVTASTITGNTISGGTINGTTITGSTLTSATVNGSVRIANGSIDFFKNDDTTVSPFSQIKHVYDSGQGDSIEWQNSGYTKLVNTGGGQWTADFVQFALNANNPQMQLQIYPDSDGTHTKLLSQWIDINGNFRPRQLASTADYFRFVIALCKSYNGVLDSWWSGRVIYDRQNGVIEPHCADVVAHNRYGGGNGWVSLKANSRNTGTSKTDGAQGWRPCTFIYGGETYAGIEGYFLQSAPIYIFGCGSFAPFAVHYYNTNTSSVLNNEVYNSLNFFGHSGFDNTLSILGGGTGATTAQAARNNLQIWCTRLAANVGGTEVTVTSDWSPYSSFILVGTAGNSYTSTATIPKVCFRDYGYTKFQVADDLRYIGVTFRVSGNTLYARVTDSSISGKTVDIYGLYGA